MEVLTNMVKVNPNIIPDEIYLYKIFNRPEDGTNIYRIAYNNMGVVIDSQNRIIATPLELEYQGKFAIEDEISFSELPENHQCKLILRILRDKGISDYTLSKILQKYRRPKIFGDFEIMPEVKSSVIKHDNNFYLLLHLSHQIRSKKTLWELVGKNKEMLRDFLKEHRETILLRDIASEYKTVYKPSFERYSGDPNIIESHPDDVQHWYDYHLERYWNTPELKKEFYKKFGPVELDQPIILARPIKRHDKRDLVHLLPQFVVPVYNAEQLDANLASEILDYLKLAPDQRILLLSRLLNNIKANTNVIVPSLVKFRANVFDIDLNNVLQVRNTSNVTVTLAELKTSKTKLFTWMNSRKYPIILPYEVPKRLKEFQKIPVFIVLDSALPEDIQTFAKKEFTYLINSLQKSLSSWVDFPVLNIREKYIFTIDLTSDRDIVNLSIKLSYLMKNAELGLAFIATRTKLPNETFDEIKKRLFSINVISQVVNEETLYKRDRYNESRLNLYVRHNILFQVLSKLGVKYYVLKHRFSYDYIIGIDVTPMKLSHGYIGGSAVMFDSQGYIRKIIPVEIGEQSGESIDMKEFFKDMVVQFGKFGIELEGRRILIMRDGRITNDEEEGLAYISKLFNINITTFNIIKRPLLRIFTNSKLYLEIGDSIYLLPHRVKQSTGTPVPLKLSKKRVISKGNVEFQEITNEDIFEIFLLTELNYGSISADMKLPAPVHYAHKFVRALRKGWRIKEDLLAEGFLYFV